MKISPARSTADLSRREFLAATGPLYAAASVAEKRKLPPYYNVELAIENGTKITRSVVENHRRSRDYVREVFRA
jgi:hypothetical protein